MQILAHRGFWKTQAEKNTRSAFERAFSLGFGIETDLRDLDGEIVVSHDAPQTTDDLMTFDELLELYYEYDSTSFLALNVKSDELQLKIRTSLERCGLDAYALFDMSIPDLVKYRSIGLKYLSRMSDLEKYPIGIEDAKGIWLDEFNDGWIKKVGLENVFKHDKPVFVVSSELHGRSHHEIWKKLKSIKHESLYLCTDFPVDAERYFGE